MTRFDNTAEGGTNGNSITTASQGSGASGDDFTTCQGSPKWSSSSPLFGTLSYLFDTATTQFVAWDDTASASFSGRFYFTVPALPAATQNIVNIRSAADVGVGSISLLTTGALRGSAGANNQDSSATISINTTYRCEFQATGWGTASSVLNCQLYVGNNTGTPFASTSNSGVTTSATVGRIRYGRPSGTSLQNMKIDTIAQNIGASAVIGPAVAINYTRSIDDDMGIDDDPTGQVIAIGDSYTDPLGLTDAITVTIGRATTFNDVAGLTDAIAVFQTDTTNDPLGLTDNTVVSIGRIISMDEVMGLSDSVQVVSNFAQTFSDTLGLTDTTVEDQFDVFSDTLGLTDAVTVLLSKVFNVQIDDPLGATDTTTVISAFAQQFDDVMGLTDSIAINRSVQLDELLSLADSVGAVATGVVNITSNDTMGLTDAMSTLTTSIRSQSDTLGLSDNIAITLSRAYADALGLTDSIAINSSIVQSDTMGLTDPVTVLLSIVYTTSVSDVVGLSDNIQVAVSPVYGDILGLSDTVAIDRAASATDTEIISDSIAIGYGPGVSDALGITDNTFNAVSSLLSDVAGLSDTVTVVQIVPIPYTRLLGDFINLTDVVSVVHIIKYDIPPFYSNGNDQLYVTDGSITQ